MTLTEDAYAMYMAFENLYYYLYDGRVNTKCDHTPLHNFSTTDTLNSKVNNWGTEIASISQVMFECIKGIENISVDHIYQFRYMGLYEVLDPVKKGRNLDISHLMNYPSFQLNKKGRIHL